MRTLLVPLTLLALAWSTGLSAQLPGEDVRGTEVRIRGAGLVLPSGGRQYGDEPSVGTLIAVRGDTVLLDPSDGNGIERLVLRSASVVERRGRVTAAEQGAWVGFFSGLALGGAIGFTTFEEKWEPRCRSIGQAIGAALLGGRCPRKQVNSEGLRTLGGALIGALVGGGLGWHIGSVIKVDGWVPLERSGLNLAVEVGPVGSGWGPTVSLTF